MQTPLRLPRRLSGETLGQAAPASTTSRSGSSPGVGSARHFSLGGWESGPGWVWRGGGGHDIPEQSANFSASSSQTGPNLSPQPHGCLAPYHGPVALTTPWSHYGLSHVLAFACAAFPAWTAPPPSPPFCPQVNLSGIGHTLLWAPWLSLCPFPLGPSELVWHVGLNSRETDRDLKDRDCPSVFGTQGQEAGERKRRWGKERGWERGLFYEIGSGDWGCKLRQHFVSVLQSRGRIPHSLESLRFARKAFS